MNRVVRCERGGGGGDGPEAAPVKTATQIAQEKLAADVATRRQFALQDIQLQKEFAPQLTQLQETIRQQTFPGEQAVRGQLQQNVLGALQSPIGITPDQQAAQDFIRNQQAQRLSEGIRTSSNLGGGLFGGRRERREDEAQANLSAQFGSQDIERQRTQRNDAFSQALPFLQLLFPGIQISQPNFQSGAPSPNVIAQTDVTGRGQDIALQQSQMQAQAAQQSALFNALGSAAGGALGLGGAFGKPVVS